MEQTFVQLAGCEHEATLLIGYDELIAHQEDKKPMTPDAVYTETVLKLDHETFDIVDGQEGFIDQIKRGASKVYEWIKSIIKAIRDFIFGSKKKKVTEAEVSLKTVTPLVDSGKVNLTNSADNKQVKEVIRRLDTEDKKIVEEAIKQATSVDSSILKEELVTHVTGKLNQMLRSANVAIGYNKTLDPENRIPEYLSVPSDILKPVEDLSGIIENVKPGEFGRLATSLVKVNQEFNSNLAKVTVTLDKLNNEYRGHDDKARQLSRAAAYVSKLSDVSILLGDMIITLDSQLQIAIRKEENEMVKQVLKEVHHEVSEEAVAALDRLMAQM